MKNWISPVAIDLGGKNTGIACLHYEDGGDFREGDLKNQVVMVDAEKLTLSQVKRRQARHTRRNLKRRKLAKRLFRLICLHELKLDFAKHQTLISNLMNRRGYTFLGAELSDETVDALEAEKEWLEEHLPDDFDGSLSIVEVLEQLDPRDAGDLSRRIALKKEEIKNRSKAIGELEKALLSMEKAEETGHYHRKEYLKLVARDLREHPDFQPLRDEIERIQLEPGAFLNLLGHVCNLQLRPLRRYFNDPSHQAEDRWNPKRFQKEFVRWVKSWHTKSPDEKERARRLVQEIEIQGVMDALMGLCAEDSIPPFEDQNNRRPPKSQALILSISSLNQKFPDWRGWVDRLAEENQDYLKEYAEALKGLCQEKQESWAGFSKNTSELKTSEDWYLARVLQFLLDRSGGHCPYRLRLNVRNEGESPLLQSHLGSDAALEFSRLAHSYYQEVFRARKGEWFEDEEQNLLFQEPGHPPRKSKLVRNHLAAILGVSIHHPSLPDQEGLRGTGWQKLLGITKKVASDAASAQKDYGGELKTRLDGGDRKLKQLASGCEKEAKKLAQKLGLPEGAEKRFSSIFSFAQIHNLLATDIHGFSRTTEISTLDNAVRSAVFQKEQAYASRLPAQPVRPFDGFLRRSLEAQAREIAASKLAQLEKTEGKIHIPLIAEQNRFKFSAELSEIKQKNKKKREEFEKLGQAVQEDWTAEFLDKKDRIAADGMSLCPYSGQGVNLDSGEVDHILPRAWSLKNYGTVFNAEINLVLVKASKNRDKLARIATLSDLSALWLSRVFGNANTDVLLKEAEEVISVQEKNSWQDIRNLKPRERNLLRLSLFDEALRMRVLRGLQNQQKSRVNGTQKYLLRSLRQELLKGMGPRQEFSFSFHQVDAREVHWLRAWLPDSFTKGESQSAYSHVIDAQLVLLEGLRTMKELNQAEHAPDSPQEIEECMADFSKRTTRLKTLESTSKQERKNPASSSLYKAGMYAERYLPLLATSDKFGFGFEPRNMLEASKGVLASAYETLRPWLRVRGLNVPDRFEDWLDMSGHKGWITADLDRKRVHEDILANRLSEEALQLVDGLRYFTVKKPVSSVLFDPLKKTYTGMDAKKLEKKFDLKAPGAKKALKGKLNLPFARDWQKIVSLCKSHGITELARFEEEILPGLKCFDDQSKRNHSPRKRVVSLPVLESPSGIFRIRRKSWLDQEMHQSQSVEGSFKAGHPVHNGKVNKSVDSIHPVYASKNISPVGGGIVAREYVPSGKAFEMPVPKSQEGRVKSFFLEKANTRFWVTLAVARPVFEEEILPLFSNRKLSLMEYPSEMKMTGSFKEAFLGEEVFDYPSRDGKIRIQELGDWIHIRYVSNGKASMKDLYFQYARPIKK